MLLGLLRGLLGLVGVLLCLIGDLLNLLLSLGRSGLCVARDLLRSLGERSNCAADCSLHCGAGNSGQWCGAY